MVFACGFNISRSILRLRLARRGKLVTREELRTELWADNTFVDFEANLNALNPQTTFCAQRFR